MPINNTFGTTLATNNIIWVENELHGRNYPVAFGQSVILLDKNENKAYIKSVDQSGVMTGFRKFNIDEVVDPIPSDMVPKSDFENLQRQVQELQAMIEAQKNNSNYRNNNRRNYNNGQQSV